ncbi:MAG: hypothetical protein PHO41_08360 [Eubacteriales bacterium]|nr:hypothetical protein [Eubacteriales bacterium]
MQEQIQQKKDALALRFNLYDRDYAPDGKFSDDYPFYSKNDNPARFFRKIPLALAEEEYSALKQLAEQLDAEKPTQATPEGESRTATIASVYNVIGILILTVSILIGLVAGFSGGNALGYRTSGIIGFYVGIGGILSSLVFFAIAKTIHLLQEIANNTR